MTKTTLSTRIVTAIAVCALTLSGCGSDDSTSDDNGSTSDAQPSNGPGGGPGGLGDIDLEAIQECLDAAGLDDVLPTDLPTDRPSDLPTDLPTDLPSDFPTNGTPPEGFPSGGPGADGPGGGGLQALQDPEVQAALEACGIDLPQAPDGGR